MNAHAPVLVAWAGDVGGARAVLPALFELDRRGAQFVIVSHRSLAEEAPPPWNRTTLPVAIPNWNALGTMGRVSSARASPTRCRSASPALRATPGGP